MSMSVYTFTYARWPRPTSDSTLPLQRAYVHADTPSAAWKVFETLYPFARFLVFHVQYHA